MEGQLRERSQMITKERKLMKRFGATAFVLASSYFVPAAGEIIKSCAIIGSLMSGFGVAVCAAGYGDDKFLVAGLVRKLRDDDMRRAWIKQKERAIEILRGKRNCAWAVAAKEAMAKGEPVVRMEKKVGPDGDVFRQGAPVVSVKLTQQRRVAMLEEYTVKARDVELLAPRGTEPIRAVYKALRHLQRDFLWN